MKIKELQKTVNISWSPLPQNPIYLAAGTAAQQIDSGVNSTLDIYSTNFSNPNNDLVLKSSLASQYRFQKIIWSPTGFGESYLNGLIVGGCEGGNIMIYAAAKMLAGQEGLIATQNKHTGHVSGLDINPFQTNLLASCASESEIFIWDLNNTTTHMNPGCKTQPLEDVHNVSWNRQVQHILASVFSSRCVIWDLRKSEQIIKLTDTQSHVRWNALQWHPGVATQVWLASEDDRAPVVQLWDLRYAAAPAKSMQIHQRGVLGMSWCPSDTDLMVSCGKDNRIYCWNANTDLAEGEILCEVATTATWYSDVQWCPRNPAVIASSSLDGYVSIYSLFGGRQNLETVNRIADSFPGMDQMKQSDAPRQTAQIIYHDLKQAPKWIKRPCSASFGFGGKLISVNAETKTVCISQVVTEPEIVKRAVAFEEFLNESKFIEYCRNRADQMSNQCGRTLWYFIKANFELNPKEEMLNLLGYNKEDVDSKFAKFTNENEHTLPNDSNELIGGNSKNQLIDDVAGKANATIDGLNPQFEIPSGDHVDTEIAEALITGNLEAAVELCLESNRPSEALIIASTAGIEFLMKIQNRYLKDQQNELSNIISSLINRDWMNFVSRCTIKSWKEALVAILRHSERKAVDICEKLGDRLFKENSLSIENIRNAILCYICAGNIDKLGEAWFKLKQLEHNDANYKLTTEELQELAEVVMLISKSLEQQGVTFELGTHFFNFISEYVGLLASQGALTAALSYIFALGHNNNLDLEELRKRLSNAIYKTDTLKAQTTDLQQKGEIQYQQHSMQSKQRNMYSRQQPPFYPIPPSTDSNVGQHKSFQTNAWNSLPPVAQEVTLNATTFGTTPALLNPSQSNLHPQSTISQPPPLLPSSSQTSSVVQGNTFHSRSKYVLDPSVAPAASLGPNSQLYNPTTPAVVPSPGPNVFNGNNTNQLMTNTALVPTILQPSAFSNPNYSNNYLPTVPQIETAPQPSTVLLATQPRKNSLSAPGWNDPPALKTPKAPKNVDQSTVSTPITHPLYAVDNNQNQNGYFDLKGLNQNLPTSGAFQPPPLRSAENYLIPTQAPTIFNQNNNQVQPPNLQCSLQQQQQTQLTQEQPQYKAEIAKPKPPLPEQFIYLQTVLEELKNQCLAVATDPRTKRKFIDVTKRLENLYDCLRDDRLTTTTENALNQIVQFIQIGDYVNALQIQTQIAFGSDFSQCAGFMPGLKTLVQSASEMQVYLR